VRLAANAFGPAKASIVFGWVMAGHQLGSAFAALGAGIWRDVLGSYGGAFAIAGVLSVGAALLVLRIAGGEARALRVAPA
jgi:hypothetical protein